MLRVQSNAQNSIDNNAFTAGHLNTWQSGVDEAINKFISQVKNELLEGSVNADMTLVSYISDISELPQTDQMAKRLAACLQGAGLKVLLKPLVDDNSLEQDLGQVKFAIILADHAYVRAIQNFPRVKALLDKFGQNKKNALHTLLCGGDFRDIAFKVVAPNYLVRDFRAIANPNPQQDALLAEQNFIDIFLNLAGTNGLGILPDILSLNDKANQAQAALYTKYWAELEEVQLNLTIEYRLKSALASKIATHPLKAYQDNNQLELLSVIGSQAPGIEPALQSFLQGDAKINLWLGATTADVELMNLAAAQYLLQGQTVYVLSIECGLYPGKAAADCVRQELIKLKIKDTDAVRDKPIIILLQNYQNIGAYDNICTQNRLSAWPNLKVIVTCRSDFFQTRGYLKCFLPDASNRRVEDLLVYKVPTFASVEAQKAAIAISYQADVNASTHTISISPKRAAQLLELSDFLQELRKSWIDAGDLKATLAQNPQAFISYAWEGDKTALARQQHHLSRLAYDLTTAGLPTWLDIEQMTGNIDNQMAYNIASSQIAIIIGTPRYTERTLQDTNVAKEYQAIMGRAMREQNTDSFTVMPIKFLADSLQHSALPKGLLNHPNVVDLQNIDDGADYLYYLTDPSIGLIPKLLVKNPQQQARYMNVFANFEDELEHLVGKHLVVNQGRIDAQNYDMQTRLKGQLKPCGLATQTSPLTQRFDLKADFAKFLDNTKTKTYVLLGNAGSGKSLFALATFIEQLQSWRNCLPLYIALREYTQYPDTCIARALQQQFRLETQDIEALKQGLGRQQKLLFILDGYDELGSNIRPNFSQALADWPTAKLLITSRPEHFDSNNTPSDCLRLNIQGQVQFSAMKEIYVSPFSSADIEIFVKARGKGGDTFTKLQELPGLMELLNNPFLLTLVLQSLPQLLKNRVQNTNIDVTRVEVYRAFTQTWFAQETQGRDLNPEDCMQFSQDLAFEFFKNKVIGLPMQIEACNTQELKDLWQFFNNPQVSALQDAAPMRNSGGATSFLHKSVYEYFVATKLWTGVQGVNNPHENLVRLWQIRPLTEESQLIEFLAQLYQIQPAEKVLFKLVENSRDARFPEVAASNAITILNAAGVPFSGTNLNNIRIEGANLSGAIMDRTNLQRANLRKVNFENAWIANANMSYSCLDNIDFKQLPTIKLNGSIKSICYSKDGLLMAIACDNEIKIYELNTGKVFCTFKNRKVITHLAFSSDSKWIASGGMENIACIWDVHSKALFAKLRGHLDDVWCVVFSPDNRLLISGSNDLTARLWEVDSGKCLQVFNEHQASVDSVDFHPNGEMVATGSVDGFIHIWDISSGRINKSFKAEGSAAFSSIRFSRNGKYIAAGTINGKSVEVFYLQTEEKSNFVFDSSFSITKSTLPSNQRVIVRAVDFLYDDEFVAAGINSGIVYLWRLEDRSISKIFKTDSDLLGFSINPHQNIIATGSSNGIIRQWRLNDINLSNMVKLPSITAISVSSCNQYLAVGYEFGDIGIYMNNEQRWYKIKSLKDKNTSESEPNVDLFFNDIKVTGITALFFFQKSEKLLSVFASRKINIWDLKTGQPIKTLDHTPRICSIAMSPDEHWVALGHNKTITIYASDFNQEGKSFLVSYTDVAALKFNMKSTSIFPCGREAITPILTKTGDDLWELQNKNNFGAPFEYFVTRRNEWQIRTITFAPSDEWFALGLQTGDILLYRSSYSYRFKLQGHTGRILSMAFSPDNRWLVSSGEDQNLCLWSASSWTCALKINNLLAQIDCISWQTSMGVAFIITGNRDGIVQHWKVLDNKKIELQLFWASHRSNLLMIDNTNINQAYGLDYINYSLMKNKGASDKPEEKKERTNKSVSLTLAYDSIKAKAETILQGASPSAQHNATNSSNTKTRCLIM